MDNNWRMHREFSFRIQNVRLLSQYLNWQHLESCSNHSTNFVEVGGCISTTYIKIFILAILSKTSWFVTFETFVLNLLRPEQSQVTARWIWIHRNSKYRLRGQNRRTRIVICLWGCDGLVDICRYCWGKCLEVNIDNTNYDYVLMSRNLSIILRKVSWNKHR